MQRGNVDRSNKEEVEKRAGRKQEMWNVRQRGKWKESKERGQERGDKAKMNRGREQGEKRTEAR